MEDGVLFIPDGIICLTTVATHRRAVLPKSVDKKFPPCLALIVGEARWPWSHICHTPFLDTCFLIFLVTLSAAWLASEFVPTLYELKL